MRAGWSARAIGRVPSRPRFPVDTWRKGKPTWILLIGTLFGCDIPTDLPAWDQRWILPADETAVEVGKVLPDGVSLTPDSSAFVVSVPPVSFQGSLGGLCPGCRALDGLTVPKPPFEGTFEGQLHLPDDVVRIDVREGRILVVARNGFGFDPIRPGGGSTGEVIISLFSQTSAGALLDRTVVTGTNEAFPPNSTLSRTLEFSGEVVESLLVQVEVYSPLGDPVSIDLSESLSVDATLLDLQVSSASADLSGQGFTLEETVLEVGDLDQELVDRIQSGAMDLLIENPWSVGASFTVSILGPFAPIIKEFSIPGDPTSFARVDFSREELRTFLGREDVRLVGTGVVDPDAGESTLLPGQTLILETRLDLVLRIGGGGSGS